MKLFIVGTTAALAATLCSGTAQAAEDPTVARFDGAGWTPAAVDPLVPEGGPYVAADNAAEADRILDGLETGDLLPAGVRYGPCTLYPSPIRIRTDGKVGTKPQTQCSTTVSSIHHATDMRYKSLLWWVLKGTKNARNEYQSSLQQKNVGFDCVSSEESGWASTTAGTIVYNGQTYYARVYPEQVSLNCGG